MNKISNTLLLGALMCGTFATFFAGASYENKSQQTLAIAQQLNHAIALATESYVTLSPQQRANNDRQVDQLIIMASEQRKDWWLKPCSRKTLNLSLLKAFQYRGVEPALAYLNKEIKENEPNPSHVTRCKTFINATEAAYAKLTQDPAYDPLIRDLICNKHLQAKSKPAPEPMVLELPPLPENFIAPGN